MNEDYLLNAVEQRVRAVLTVVIYSVVLISSILSLSYHIMIHIKKHRNLEPGPVRLILFLVANIFLHVLC